ncbi:hypothetical protein FB451DRAFT_1172744 [Mycena latifolia]|nr:hypothetical protein FB451DRAFT_1172744 [Mycena latifolia]
MVELNERIIYNVRHQRTKPASRNYPAGLDEEGGVWLIDSGNSAAYRPHHHSGSDKTEADARDALQGAAHPEHAADREGVDGYEVYDGVEALEQSEPDSENEERDGDGDGGQEHEGNGVLGTRGKKAGCSSSRSPRSFSWAAVRHSVETPSELGSWSHWRRFLAWGKDEWDDTHSSHLLGAEQFREVPAAEAGDLCNREAQANGEGAARRLKSPIRDRKFGPWEPRRQAGEVECPFYNIVIVEILFQKPFFWDGRWLQVKRPSQAK